MKNIGIALPNLSGGMISFELLSSISSNLEIPVTVFWEEIARPCFPLTCSVMPIYEAWSFPGPVIATNFSTASKLIKMPGPSRKFYYVVDLEWVGRGQPFEQYQAVYGNPNLTLIARGETHKKILENCWNRKVPFVCPTFSIDKMMELLREIKQ